jgi:hypothetical protein
VPIEDDVLRRDLEAVGAVGEVVDLERALERSSHVLDVEVSGQESAEPLEAPLGALLRVRDPPHPDRDQGRERDRDAERGGRVLDGAAS